MLMVLPSSAIYCSHNGQEYSEHLHKNFPWANDRKIQRYAQGHLEQRSMSCNVKERQEKEVFLVDYLISEFKHLLFQSTLDDL